MKHNFFLPLILFSVLLFSSCKERKKSTSDFTEKKISGDVAFSDTSSSMVKVFTDNGKVCIQKTNTYYELTDVYSGTEKIPLLLKITKTELCVADSTNKKKVYQVEARSVLDTKKVEWTNQFVATEMTFKDNSILAIHEGNDYEEDLITRYSLLDGKEIFSCSYSELKAIVPNVRNKRFIGYTSQKATTEPIQNLKEENLLGIVRYSSSEATVNGFKLFLKRSNVAAKIPQYTPDIVLVPTAEGTATMEDGKAIVMMRADEHYTAKDLTGFSVQFTFYYGDDNESTVILVPVSNDQLDFANAKYDKDIFEIAVL